jgi:DNA modification methylase
VAVKLTWTTKRVKLSDLLEWDHNPVQISERDAKELAKSLSKFDHVLPYVAAAPPNGKKGLPLLDGHQRKMVEIQLNKVPASTLVDVRIPSRKLTDKEREELVIRLRKNTGTWDFDKLANFFEVDDLLEWGFTKDELEGGGFDMDEERDAEPQIDKAEELLKKWKVKPGDLFSIGGHLLICADSTDKHTFERLLKKPAAMAVTSPPYGVGKSYETKGISAWYETIRPVIANLCNFTKLTVWQLVDLYSTGQQYIEPTSAYSVNMFMENGFRPIWIRIWEKQGMNFGVGAYHLVTNKPVQQYEYLIALEDTKENEEDAGGDIDSTEFSWVTAFAPQAHKFVKRLSRKERREWGYAGVWKINTVTANKDHPAMFPLELPARCIKMHSDVGDEVVEPFSGSGTTMVACENLGRKARAVELDPKFCAVALQRMTDAFPGIHIERVKDGKK